MKVLLLGEFSSLHKFLKEGLLELGNIEVTLAGNGDGWKKINGNDLILYRSSNNVLSKRYYLWIEPYYIANRFKNYNVVQFINTQIYSSVINEHLLKKIAKRNQCVSLVAAGNDYGLFRTYLSKKLDYVVFDYDKNARERYNRYKIKGLLNIHNDKSIETISDIIIPVMYEYMVGYSTEKRSPIIPLPINVKKFEYKENNVKQKIIFFHGINKELAKGTPIIQKALMKLKHNYPNDVEVVIDGHMPYDKYIKVMQCANVIIDQCCTYSYGINACIAMAQGKVVLAGNRQETRDGLGVSHCPILHIEPDVNQIYQQLVYLVENKMRIAEIGYESRKYVEDTHDNIKIAQRYVEAWKSTGKL